MEITDEQIDEDFYIENHTVESINAPNLTIIPEYTFKGLQVFDFEKIKEDDERLKYIY